MALALCSKCQRSFNLQSIEIHERVCRGKNPVKDTLNPRGNRDQDNQDTNPHSTSDLNVSQDLSSDSKPNYSAVPMSNFVVCKTCGKTFTIHSIDKHTPACEKKAEFERKEHEAQRRHEAGPKNVGRLPGVVCYICGRNFGTTSIEIHEKLCLEKFRKEQSMLPKKERRPEPIKPQTNKEMIEQMVKEQKLAGNKEYNQQAAMNDLNAVAYNQNLVACPNCQRTFNPDALKFHAKACTYKHPARKVGEVTQNH